MNNKYLAQYGINAVVTGINLDAGKHTVMVQVSANLDRLFPSLLRNVVVSKSGFAEIRAFTQAILTLNVLNDRIPPITALAG